jgi:Annexin
VPLWALQVLCARSKEHLKRVDAHYHNMYGTSLLAEIHEETSGYYRQVKAQQHTLFDIVEICLRLFNLVFTTAAVPQHVWHISAGRNTRGDLSLLPPGERTQWHTMYVCHFKLPFLLMLIYDV